MKTSERWQQIKPILEQAADKPEEEIPGWLEEACAGDSELQREVESFLAYEDDLTTFIADSPVRRLIEERDEATADLGSRIGPYRIRQLLGRGGMGNVYLAEREEGFEQRVALKLVQSGFETRETMRRFHRERQILARLEHPNISRLLDGGATGDGRPYFAMELVAGTPIDRYCAEQRLRVRQRLELLLPVCDALQFAHRNLVIHRDLKPSNILVTADGVPKLLDFGIAKLLERPFEGDGGEVLAPESDGSFGAATELGQQPMTPHYASPEQLRGDPISTASDVYALGVLLYVLLTGRLPCGLDRLDRPQAMRAVLEEEPLPPSKAVRGTGTAGRGDERQQTATVAGERGVGPAALHRRLAGDLDAIAGKALAKEPAARYASVEQLAADLRHHLDSRPVTARDPTLAYRAGRYARRHRWGLATGLAVLALIVGFTAVLAHQLDRTERQRDRAERVSTFLVQLFRAAEPDRAGAEPSVRELVDIGRQRLETELADEPEQRAALLDTLGQVYFRLGHFEASRESLMTAVEILHRRHAGDRSDLARALNDLATVEYERGEIRRAEELYRQSIAMRERLGLDEELRKPRTNLAAILMLRGELDEAETIYRWSLAERRAKLRERHPALASSLRSLATVLYLRGDFDAAEPLLREALRIRIEAYGRDSPAAAGVLASLGRLAHARGDLDAAEPLYSEALDIRRRRLGEDHLHVATLGKDFAALLVERGDLDAAGKLLEPALDLLHRHKPEGDWNRADADSVYGAYLAARGSRAEAEPLLRSALATLERARGPGVLPTRQARRRLAEFEELDALPGGGRITAGSRR